MKLTYTIYLEKNSECGDINRYVLLTTDLCHVAMEYWDKLGKPKEYGVDEYMNPTKYFSKGKSWQLYRFVITEVLE